MRRQTPLLLVACVVLGFLLATALQSEPAGLENRLPTRFELADLISTQRSANERLQERVATLRRDVDELRSVVEGRTGEAIVRKPVLAAAQLAAGMVPVAGPGLQVTLDDSQLEPSEARTVNDLVIHSQDVQAVVNALWRAGAEAISINDQRLVSTSAVLCVGNTLLLNGTVHSPPYVVTAVGATRDRFESDPLVRRLRTDASDFGLRFAVDRVNDARVPGYDGSTTFRYARPV